MLNCSSAKPAATRHRVKSLSSESERELHGETTWANFEKVLVVVCACHNGNHCTVLTVAGINTKAVLSIFAGVSLSSLLAFVCGCHNNH